MVGDVKTLWAGFSSKCAWHSFIFQDILNKSLMAADRKLKIEF